jgi:hypothetical protein
MAMVTGTVEVALNPNKYGKFAMLVNEVWYSTNPEWLENKPSKGDTVSFDDKGKKYIHNLTITGKGSFSPAASSSGGSKGYSTLGVELGHASKLAMDMALTAELPVGGDEFYKFWIEHTQKVHTVMTGLRKKYESSDVVEGTASPTTVIKGATKPSATDVVSDIF